MESLVPKKRKAGDERERSKDLEIKKPKTLISWEEIGELSSEDEDIDPFEELSESKKEEEDSDLEDVCKGNEPVGEDIAENLVKALN